MGGYIIDLHGFVDHGDIPDNHDCDCGYRDLYGQVNQGNTIFLLHYPTICISSRAKN